MVYTPQVQRNPQSVPPDDQATVPGAVTRAASPSLPPPTLDEGGTLAFEVEHTPTLMGQIEDADEGPADVTMDHTVVPDAPGQPWMIWAAVALLVAVGIGALLLL